MSFPRYAQISIVRLYVIVKINADNIITNFSLFVNSLNKYTFRFIILYNMLIDKKILEYLAELSRIEISDKQKATSKKEEKLLSDLQNILGYFGELKEINTKGVEPLAGGTIKMNVFREDRSSRISTNLDTNRTNIINQFPEEENGYLKVPPVFE